MTLMDLIKLAVIKSDATAEKFSADLIDCWHDDKIPGELTEVLGLSPREYQAWTTGGGFAADNRALAADEPSASGHKPALVQARRQTAARKSRLPLQQQRQP